MKKEIEKNGAKHMRFKLTEFKMHKVHFIRRNIFILLIFILSLLIIASTFTILSEPQKANNNKGNENTISQFENTTNNLIFPNINLSQFDNANELCNLISANLGFTDLTPFLDNSHNLSNFLDSRNESRPFSDIYLASYWYHTYHWWGKNDDVAIGALFNQDDLLVQITINNLNFQNNNMKAVSDSKEDLRILSYDLAMLIDINITLISDIEVFHVGTRIDPDTKESTEFWKVSLSYNPSGNEIFGANHIYFDFMEEMLQNIVIYPFYEFDPINQISDDQIRESVRVFIESEFNGSGNLIILDEPQIRKEIFFDQEFLIPVRMVEQHIESKNVSPWPILVIILINMDTGTPVSYRTLTGVPSYNPTIPFYNDPFFQSLILILFSIVVIGGLIYSWPPETTLFFFLSIFISLYSKLKEEDILSNYNRGIIYGYIMGNPGVTFSELKRKLSIANGSLVYHLEILQKSGEIFSRKAGNLIRFYGKNVNTSKISNLELTDLQNRIIQNLISNGPSSKIDILKDVNTSRQTLHYNLRKLIADGVIESNIIRGKRYYNVSTEIELINNEDYTKQ